MNNLYEIKLKNLSWINVTKPAKPQTSALSKKFSFLEKDDLTDVLPPIQRMKLVERPDYVFLIMHFPVYDRKAGIIFTEELDFFIMKNNLVTIHGGRIPVLEEIFKNCEKDKNCGDMADLVYKIIYTLLNYCFPMLRHINTDIENIEKKLFAKYEKRETIETALRIKTNIFEFQRSMRSHEYVLRKLMERGDRFFPTKKLNKNFINLVDYAKEINLSLEGFKDTINALHEANATLVDYRANEITKLLTIFAVIIFPLTLIAALFGMNTIYTPIVGTNYDFWKIAGILAGGAIMMLGYFKWKRWL